MCKAFYPRLTRSLKPSIFYSAFKQETLLLETGITHTSGGFKTELFICSVWSSWRNYFANWLQAKRQGTSPPCSLTWFGTACAEPNWCEHELCCPAAWTLLLLHSLGLNFWERLRGWGFCFPISTFSRRPVQAENGHWCYLDHETAVVILSAAVWSADSIPTPWWCCSPPCPFWSHTQATWYAQGQDPVPAERQSASRTGCARTWSVSYCRASSFPCCNTSVQDMQASGCRRYAWSPKCRQ